MKLPPGLIVLALAILAWVAVLLPIIYLVDRRTVPAISLETNMKTDRFDR